MTTTHTPARVLPVFHRSTKLYEIIVDGYLVGYATRIGGPDSVLYRASTVRHGQLPGEHVGHMAAVAAVREALS